VRRFFARRETIERVAREAAEDARAEGVTRLEMRFSPAYFCVGHNPQDVAEWIARSCRAPGLEVTFVATVARSLPYRANAPTIDVALGGRLFVGMDLAGNELESDGLMYEPALRKAREIGMGVTVHAAEHPLAAAGARFAVERLHAERIGHGLFAPAADLQWLASRGVVFEMCPTSNRLLGGWDPATHYPAREWARRGMRVTINTDDPRVFGTTLPREFEAAGLRPEEVERTARGALFPRT
jgi:adenosine deaminase